MFHSGNTSFSTPLININIIQMVWFPLMKVHERMDIWWYLRVFFIFIYTYIYIYTHTWYWRQPNLDLLQPPSRPTVEASVVSVASRLAPCVFSSWQRWYGDIIGSLRRQQELNWWWLKYQLAKLSVWVILNDHWLTFSENNIDLLVLSIGRLDL